MTQFCRLDVRKAIVKTYLEKYIDGNFDYVQSNIYDQILIKSLYETGTKQRNESIKKANELVTTLIKKSNGKLIGTVIEGYSYFPVKILLFVNPKYTDREFDKLKESNKNKIEIDLGEDRYQFRKIKEKIQILGPGQFMVFGEIYPTYGDATNAVNNEINNRGLLANQIERRISKVGVDPNLRSNYFVGTDTTRTKTILKKIAEGDTGFAKLAEHLLQFTKINNPFIYLNPDEYIPSEDEKGDTINAAGLYDPNTNTIQIAEFANFRKGGSENTILHEILHGFSHYLLNNNSEASKVFQTLYEKSLKELGGYNVKTREGYYGNHTIDEFFVALFTDGAFIKKLKEVEPVDTKHFKNLYEEIMDLILSLLKLVKGDSLYEQAFSVAGTILQEGLEYNEANQLMNQQYQNYLSDDNVSLSLEEVRQNEINFTLKSIDILQSTKADEIFRKGDKNNWNIDKILLELNIPKEQKELIKSFGTRNREEILTNLLANYSYAIEINIAKENKETPYTLYKKIGEKYVVFNVSDEQLDSFDNKEDAIKKVKEYNYLNTQHYSNLTVPGGTNYTENAIQTPNIINSSSAHIEDFANGISNMIGWFRSDEQGRTANYEELGKIYEAGITPFDTNFDQIPTTTKTRRILEVQSDLFQKGRDKTDLVREAKIQGTNKTLNVGDKVKYIHDPDERVFIVENVRSEKVTRFYPEENQTEEDIVNIWTIGGEEVDENEIRYYIPVKADINQNQFLQLLNKDSNWVTFFLKSIVQDSAKKGYEKVLFPSGNTASKVEGHTTLEEFKKQKEDRIKQLESYKNKPWTVSYKAGKDIQSFATENQAISFSMGYNDVTVYKKKDDYSDEISQLKQELERVETEGFGALKPIYKFYGIDVRNTLVKQYGEWVNTEVLKNKYGKEWKEKDLTWQELQDHVKSDILKFITDEYGNTWNEVKITNNSKSKILLNPTTQSYQPNKDINFNLTNLNFTPEVLQHLYKQSKKTKTFEEYSKIIQLVATNLMATDLTNEEIIDKLTCI